MFRVFSVSGMSNDVRWLLMAVPRCLQFLFVFWSSVRHRSCKVLWRRRFVTWYCVCASQGSGARVFWIDVFAWMQVVFPKIVLWWCGFAPETHCTVPSLCCQQIVSVLVPRWDVLVVWSCQPRTKLRGECRPPDTRVCNIFDSLNH